MYSAFKHLHLTFIAISVLLFLLRFVWVMRDSAMMQKKWVKIVPHINDTLLLLSAVGLMVMIHQYPFVNTWLTAKLLGLVAYIGFATMALKSAGGKRWLGFALAVITLWYVVNVAVTKSALASLG
ncbi:invasion protein [Idiomarina tyrosinivorans]|uniref:Invasion protein n=1 Tax=Idiomarina tyrosinivorans TaxID=1445662 RepID=A0A432ZRF0_9GAMM|nr:SirB2 family protein [Idiomarina tyrosinivorans]RUO80480.1 invasion protein [Idiomarina tyrosinivorans]